MIDIKELFQINPLLTDPQHTELNKRQKESLEVLVRAHGSQAPEEALFRALSSERTDDVQAAFHWVGIYVELKTNEFKV